MKAVVATFNQEKAQVGAFSVITNLRMQFGCNFLRHYIKAEHGRSYGSRAEEEERLRVFSANLARIEAHNAGGHSWRMGVNKFADLTKYDFLHS